MKRFPTEIIVFAIIMLPPFIFSIISLFADFFIEQYIIKEILCACTILSIPVFCIIAILVVIYRSDKDDTDSEEYKALVGDVSKLSKEERIRKERENGIMCG